MLMYALPSLASSLACVLFALVAFGHKEAGGVAAVPAALPPPPAALSAARPHPALVATRRAVGSVMSALGAPDPADVREYAGNLYGVSAEVTLDFAERRADVALWGVPIAGRVAGFGWLSNGAEAQERGAVVLDAELQAKLDRRFVRVVSAGLDRVADTVTVCVDVPVLGEQSLVLRRVRA